MRAEVTQESQVHLEQILHAGVHCATGLKEILKEERNALETQNTDALNNSGKNKHVFLTKLEDLEVERRKICIAGGFEPDAPGMEQLVKTCDSDSPLLGYWTDFVDLARECSDLNIANGAIINLRRQQIAGALSVVRGENHDNETYSRNGRDNPGNTKRILAEI